MRLLGRLLVLLLVLAFAAYGWTMLGPMLRNLAEPRRTTPPVSGPSESVAYALDAESWTRFPFSTPPRLVRLVANADLPPAALNEPETSWRYGIEYQVIDAAGAVLAGGTFFFRTQLPVYRNPVSGAIGPARTYAGRVDVPTAPDLVLLDLADQSGAAEIRARLVDPDPEVTGVALRVYERRPAVSPGQANVAWQRLSPDDRADLAEGSVFPPALLGPAERVALVRNAWSPIGPSGVEGVDYVKRVLITHGVETTGKRLRPAAPPEGVYMDADRQVTVQLPEEGGEVRFEVTPLEGTGATSLTARWFGAGHMARATQEFRLGAGATSVQGHFEGGLVEISVDAPLILRVLLTEPDGIERDLTAEIARLRVYALDADKGLDYSVTTIGDATTPFRLVFRCACFGPDAPARGRAEVRFAIHAEDGRVLEKGEASVEAVPSSYDRLDDDHLAVLSEPREFFFNLPPMAATLRLWADAPVFVSAFNRPPDLIRQFLIPEDYFAANMNEERRMTWYAIRPEEGEAGTSNGRAPLIVTPRRPPEEDPDILAGRYDWEQFLPEGDWLARDLLIRREPEQVTRREALSSRFVSLPLGEEVALDFAAPLESAELSPQIVYLRDQAAPAVLEVFVDGERVQEAAIGAARGVVPLPPVTAGPHRLKLVSKAELETFVNHVEDAPAILMRRRAIRLPVGETTFEIEKRTEGEELIIGQIFPQAEAPGRQNLEVLVENVRRLTGPIDRWTLAHREYSIRLNPDQRDVPVLGADLMVGPGRRVLIALGTDLPPGRYPLRITLKQGPEVYLVLSRTVPSLVAQRDIIQE